MATRWQNLPGLKDDVVERVKEDLGKAKKGRNVDSSKLSGTAKEIVREAGSRAQNRNIGRAGAGQAAFEAGYTAGRAIDEKTGLGKKMVEKSGLGSAAERMANRRDKVELSQNAKDRLEDEDVDQTLREVNARRKAGEFDPENQSGPGMKRGGKVKKMASGGSTASKRADGIASRGKTKCKMY